MAFNFATDAACVNSQATPIYQVGSTKTSLVYRTLGVRLNTNCRKNIAYNLIPVSYTHLTLPTNREV